MSNTISHNAIIIAAIITGICTILGSLIASYFTKKNVIKSNINKNSNPLVTYTTRACNYGKMALEAKECIFSSSIFMAFLSDLDIQKDFSDVKPEIPITLVVLNGFKPEMLKCLKMVNGFSNIEDKENGMPTIVDSVKIAIDRIKSKRTVIVKRINFIVPISYFAVDYKNVTKSSFIQVKHYLLNNKGTLEYFYCTVLPGSDLYEQFKKQILLLEECNENFSNWNN